MLQFKSPKKTDAFFDAHDIFLFFFSVYHKEFLMEEEMLFRTNTFNIETRTI